MSELETERRAVVFTQPDPRFRGPAYQYLRKSDGLATYEELGADPLCKVKLFLPEGRWTYFVAAVTLYGQTPVLTGYCLSPLEPAYDEWGDSSLLEVAAVRSAHGLPMERDLDFEPMRPSEIRAAIAAGRTP